jgi:hypothetical protein
MALQPNECKTGEPTEQEVADNLESYIDYYLDRYYKHDGAFLDYFIGLEQRQKSVTENVFAMLKERYYGWDLQRVDKDECYYIRFTPKVESDAKKIS